MARLVEDLQSRLQTAARDETRTWWERYLKGEARFRGVPLPVIRSILGEWSAAHAVPGDLPDGQLLDLADGLLRQPETEDKLAGMLLLQSLVAAGRLSWRPAVDSWRRVFEDGAIADWNTCDWFAVKVLGPLIRREGEACGRAVAAWVEADGLWPRRASTVAFVQLVRDGDAVFPGLADVVLANCDRLVADPERFAQTAAGWVLRELSRTEPGRVRTFVAGHEAVMSREAIRKATRYLT